MTMYPGDFYVYSYGYDIMEGALGAVLGIYLFFLLLTLAVGVAFYVLQGMTFYSIAKRRGIRNPWLAWIPVGCYWILGSISDQYQYVKKGKVKNRRKILLGLSVAVVAASLLYMVGAFSVGFAAGLSGTGEVGVFVMLMLLYMLVEMALAITLYVFMYMSLYDLYASCDPSNAVLYLLLSIFINVTMPFFLFACRKKDYGMPPRRNEIPQQPVMSQTAWSQQQPAQTRYEPAADPTEE